MKVTKKLFSPSLKLLNVRMLIRRPLVSKNNNPLVDDFTIQIVLFSE